jgi:hypothetical protein
MIAPMGAADFPIADAYNISLYRKPSRLSPAWNPRVALNFCRAKNEIRICEDPPGGGPPPRGQPRERRKSEISWVPSMPGRLPSVQVGSPHHKPSMKAGLFCVCESRLSHRTPIFFFRPTGGESRQPQSHVARNAHVSMHNVGDNDVSSHRRFSNHSSSIGLSPVARHGPGPNVRLK